MAASVPFTNAEMCLDGVVRLEEDELILDFMRISAWGHTSAPVKIHIPLRHVDALEYKNYFFLFHVLLRLRVRNLDYLASVPGAHGAEVTLFCRRRYRGIARELANLVTFRLLERAFTDDRSPVQPGSLPQS